ncbi:MAG: hypothetical protein F4Y39_08585 [Gemmatimonadetes bacterium]|nr:hypothetical protein [Gemmatimonadota bacterium]MYK51698.1 hypothetical protein [Gemmatimonadota bacterium]
MSTPLSEQANYFVYRITFEDGSEYIGITGVGIQNRLKKHQQTQNKVGILIRAGVKWECVCIASGLTRREALD